MTHPPNANRNYDMLCGPVPLPGDEPTLDHRAWEALEQADCDPVEYMLMHYEPMRQSGITCAAFKHRDTRIYRRVSFRYSYADPSWRAPKFEPLRDYAAQLGFVEECERLGVDATGCREVLEVLRARCAVQGLTVPPIGGAE